MVERSLASLDLKALAAERTFFPSPAHWEDEVFYFLLLDRFSDGQEDGYLDSQGKTAAGSTPLYKEADNGNACLDADSAARWRAAGCGWVGGTIDGLRSKLGYLRRLGVTSVWVSPVFKQVASLNTYHGYGIQNFLDTDPHFGTREQLQQMVREAHAQGIRVILDIILNHAGNVFGYAADRYPYGNDPRVEKDPRWDGAPYFVAGYRDAAGAVTLPFGGSEREALANAWPDGAVWPAELQAPATFTQRGRINSWDWFPEYLEGDFYDLKDIAHGERAMEGGVENPALYRPSAALQALCQVYKFWLAYLDLDGYRIDTVKHMDLGATRYFCSAIHEYAEALGKTNFYLIGEVTGGRDRAFTTQEATGLDAALGIDDIQGRLESLVKGESGAGGYFDLFRNSIDLGKESHRWFRDKVITQIDDHDQVRRGGSKARFCAGAEANRRLVLAALALNAMTLGVPCIYYGTEQGFDGAGGGDFADRYIREAMFGGEFGAFRTRGRHLFDESQWVYRELAKILAVRRQYVTLRRGRQYLREISGDGVGFGLPSALGGAMRSIVPWSRVLSDEEVLVAINTDAERTQSAWVTVDASLHAAGSRLRCVYSTDEHQAGTAVTAEARNGAAVHLTVPPAGFVVFA